MSYNNSQKNACICLFIDWTKPGGGFLKIHEQHELFMQQDTKDELMFKNKYNKMPYYEEINMLMER